MDYPAKECRTAPNGKLMTADDIREAASALPAAVSETSAANRLVDDPLCRVDPLCHEGTGEAHHKEGRDCYRDQVNRPRVALSADKIEMSGMAFVPIGVKAHDSGLLLA
jgi:hypothetical protein